MKSQQVFMSRTKIIFLGTAILMGTLLIAISNHWRVREYYFRYKFDLTNPQKPINSRTKMDVVMQNFKVINYKDLSGEYKTYTKSERSKYKALLGQKTYFEIGRKDFYKKIVGNFRIEDLLAKDKYYRRALKGKSRKYYWLIDKRLLYNLLELQNELDRQGYNKWGFGITNGHRHPRYNERIGGAKLSRHIMGEAIDIRVYDIDRNGKYTQKDKDIVLKILEEKIIKDNGGIGRYPGTRAIHFDVRGYRARWDSY